MNALVGREHALSTLGSHLDAAARGSGSCVIVEGQFGTGKTRLLKATALEGADRGLTVIAGQARGTDQPLPLQWLINLVRHVTPGAAGLGDLARPDRNPFWLMDRLGELLESAARRHPLMIVLDDTQRIDDVSGLALRGLVQSLAPSPVLWLLARRPVSTRSLAQHAIGWLADHSAVRLHLGTLDDEAVAEMCTRTLGAKPDASVLSWAARCGGNPWLVENLFNAFIDAGQVVIMDGTASVLAERLPADVHAAVGRLLGQMPAATRRLLVCGRKIGQAFTAEEASVLLEFPAAELSASVDDAVQAGLLHKDGGKLTFAHEVIGEALRQAAFQEEPAGAVVATATSATPVPAPVDDTVAPASDPRVQPVGRITAAAAMHRSPDGATGGCGCDELTARAMSTLGEPFDELPRTLAPAVRLLAAAGRSAEAGRLAAIAVRPGIKAAAETHLSLELGQGLRDAGRHDMSAELLQRTLARHDICELDRAKLKGAITGTTKRVSGLPGSVPAPWRGQPVSLAPPLTSGRDAVSHSATAPTAESFPATEPGKAAQHGCGGCGRPLWAWLLRALIAADRWEEATAVCTAVRQEAEKLGTSWPRSLWHGHHAQLLAATGRLEEARAEAEAALRPTDRTAPEESVPARIVLARISMLRGDLATASEQLRTAERLVTEESAPDKVALDWVLAQFHAASGRPEMTVQTLINVEGQVTPGPLLFAEAPTAAATLVRLAKQVGLAAEAEQTADFARRIAERNPTVQSLAGGAEHAEGTLRGDPAALHRAVELYRLAGRPLAAAGAFEDMAQVEQSLRDRPRAVRLLESAKELYLDCGAQRDVARVQKKLRHLGVLNVRGLGADLPKSGWASLTSAELRVVRAIVDGRTNREAATALFLSPHTVDSHLRRVFSKLDIKSRVELTKHFIANESHSPVLSASQQHGSAG
ncbi:DUF2791 family P-loop domain-containing protein [Streptomyces sp. NBC_01283]|uniref:helix-turn-helix transcriptional regulator n=1 Tax=Streptomyces sp. NBC_01283 TaxID=2903812 RepID=UPI00352FB13E|nr:DUF2791 family P-loop domain-containing protein [Streptomyces sp. NBC_01283]